MGMMIDEAIEHGKEQLEIFGGEHKEFIETSIETMHKYQKIQEIVKNADTSSTIYQAWCFSKIKEVVEDGNDD